MVPLLPGILYPWSYFKSVQGAAYYRFLYQNCLHVEDPHFLLQHVRYHWSISVLLCIISFVKWVLHVEIIRLSFLCHARPIQHCLDFAFFVMATYYRKLYRHSSIAVLGTLSSFIWYPHLKKSFSRILSVRSFCSGSHINICLIKNLLKYTYKSLCFWLYIFTVLNLALLIVF